jgi:hypothetical protein
MRRVAWRWLAALVAVAVAGLAVPAGASAFAVTSVTVTTQDPSSGPSSGPALPPSGNGAAGAHPDFVTRIDFSDSGNGSADSAKDLLIHFAPGIVAFVNHVPSCSQANFAASDTTTPANCPGSAVGTVVTGITSDNSAVNVALDPPSGSDPQVDGTIYRIDPPPGFPAAFGIDIAPPIGDHIKLISPISVDPHDLGLTASLSGLPNSATLPVFGTVGLHTNYIVQTLDGYVGGKSFFTSPTACIAAAVSVSATSHAGASGSASGAYTPTDCAHEPFSTSLAISATPPITDSPSEISADVKPGASDVPRTNSHVKSDTVTLPPGVLINPALAARLDACTDAQFAQSDTSVPARCPPSSAVGDITFVSPILGAFPGKAYFGTQTPTDRLRLFLDVPLFGAHIKVSAHVHPSFTTGQITTVFDQLPQIAFTDFQLTFHGGPRSALVTPATCGVNTATATVLPWSGGPASTSSASFTTSYDGMGAPCRRVFEPSISASVSNARAGAATAFTLVVTRPDRNVPIGRMRFSLPAGLIGNLALKGLTRCSLADAAAGRCPASSRIGGVTALAGSGSEPPSLPGDVFLTQPKVAGDPAGLSVKVPARLGPVDAGVVIVGVRLQLRSDGGLDATSDPIPALQEGIPLALRQLTVTIDRPGFMRNPTSCGRKTLSGSLDAIGGPSASVSTTLTFADCGRLRFAPRLGVRLRAKGAFRTGGHPGFRTLVTQRAGEAGIGRARVVLPTALATNLRAVAAACQPAALAARTCSSRARVATAAAISPFVDRKLLGPVYLVAQAPGKLPKLVVQLRGPVSIRFEGIVSIGAGGNIATTFTPPDLPVSAFSLTFHGGRYGALAASRDLCTSRPFALRALFTGQNGATRSLHPRIAVNGCPRPHHRRR